MKKLCYLMALIAILVAGGFCLADDAQKVAIYYEGNAQVELVSPQGTRVLIDVYDPGLLSSPVTDKDILLTTHGHSDHFSSLASSFTGPSLIIKAGSLKVGDAAVQGIPSGHKASDPFLPEKGTNYIFIVDIGGLRIAHFGDIGQEKLTPEQLAALGKVDIAITQFANINSNMDVDNLKGFNLMDQLKPKMIIPAHEDIDTMKYAAKQWKTYFAENPLKIGASDLDGATKMVLVGEKKRMMSKIVKAAPWVGK